MHRKRVLQNEGTNPIDQDTAPVRAPGRLYSARAFGAVIIVAQAM